MNPKPDFALSAHGAERRLASLAKLDESEVQALRQAMSHPQRLTAQREIVAEGWPAVEPSILLQGWVARVRHFRDGRRQILSFLVPGDLIGMCRHTRPLASTTLMALTQASMCRAPEPQGGRAGAGLAEAYAVSGAIEEHYMFRQIARIGRLSAHERLIDWMLEMHDRLTLVGLAEGNTFPMPLTQEALADALGLTSVHVNRTLQAMRRDQLIDLRGGIIRLADPQQLAQMVDHRPAKVSG